MSFLTEVNCITILDAIKKEKLNQKSLAEKQKNDDYIEINPEENTFWTGLFANCFLCTSDESIKNELTHDDLLFFVSKINLEQNKIEVFRRDSKKLPCLTDFNYDWEETVYLNLILHQFEYTLTCAICTQTSDKDLEIIKRHSKRVFASPSKRDLESKGTEESITYPFIYFTVDDFDEAFNDMIVREGQMVCVELVANDTANIRKVLFLGSIRYEALKKVYDARASTGSKFVEKMSLGSFGKKRVEFIKMKGPGGKGYAQMAISQHQTTEASIPSTASSNELDSFQQLLKLPVGFRKKSHTTSSATSPDVELREFRQDSSTMSNGGGSFWNKTLSQFNLFNKSKSSTTTAHTSQMDKQECDGVLLNSYLTYVTLNIQSIINGTC